MLFLEDHIRAVLPALAARRDALRRDGRLPVGRRGGAADAAGPVRRWRADGAASLALLKRLRGKPRPAAQAAQGQMKMLRQLPKILRFIPGTAQDVRAYFLTLQYWLAGSDENVAQPGPLPGRPLCGRAARAAARHAAASPSPSSIPKSASTTRACEDGSATRRDQLPRPAEADRPRRPAADALLPAGRQHRALRRRDRGAGGAGPDRSSRPSPAASTRARRSSAFS